MKKLLFISLTCLIVATSLGQNKNNQKLEIPKKSNTIELTTTYKTQQEALNEIVKILLREGIEPEKIDRCKINVHDNIKSRYNHYNPLWKIHHAWGRRNRRGGSNTIMEQN